MPRDLKLIEVAAVLRDMQRAGVIGDFAVGGATAVAFYAEPIATKDLDIFFLFDPPQDGVLLSLEPIYRYCEGRGFTFDHEFVSIGGWPVQFVESGYEPLWKNALSNALHFDIDGIDLGVLPPEHLAVMWAKVARAKDILKIQHFAESKVLDVEKLRDILDRFESFDDWKEIQGGLPDEFKF